MTVMIIFIYRNCEKAREYIEGLVNRFRYNKLNITYTDDSDKPSATCGTVTIQYRKGTYNARKRAMKIADDLSRITDSCVGYMIYAGTTIDGDVCP